jgi:hypothetical protein
MARGWHSGPIRGPGVQWLLGRPVAARSPAFPFRPKLEFFASPTAAGLHCAFRSGSGTSFKWG